MDTVKNRLKAYISYRGIGQAKFEKLCGLANGYVNNIRQSITPGKLQKIALSCPDLNTGWLITGEGNMLKPNTTVIQNTSGIIVNGNNTNGHIDNRQYYSDSPDVLRAQIELLDERIKEKDAQIKEKDAQIKQLLDILQKK